ncbi:MAG: hypothetical protein I8H75_04640 [Myxococcaceae bacterium]|nr:hypothetical protein [Myxococcaceae bacterium]MBH2006611.1 hypothetical protein [Myxococcaceae bacterium]
MTNDSGGDFVEEQPKQNATQLPGNTNAAWLPVSVPWQRAPHVSLPIFPLLSALSFLDWPQLVDNSLQEFLRRLSRWRPRTVNNRLETPRHRLAWTRDVREGRAGAGGLTTTEVRESYQGPFSPNQFRTSRQGTYFRDDVGWNRIEERTICDTGSGLIYRRVLQQHSNEFAFQAAAPRLYLNDQGSRSEDTVPYADLVGSILATDNRAFATNILRVLKNSEKPLQGNTVEAARKVAQRILVSERPQSEAALALAYTEVYRLKHSGYDSAMDVFGRGGSYIPARTGAQERSQDYTLEQVKYSFDVIARFKAEKNHLKNEDSVVKKLRKLVTIFGYDMRQEIINRPLFGECFSEARASRCTPELPGHRAISVSGEGNACLLRSVLIGVFPEQRQRIANLPSSEIRKQVREAINASLADPETGRLLFQDYEDYLDLFGRQSLSDSMTHESYLNHFVSRETFEGREMIALLAHVYQRRIYVHNQDRYLEEQFGDSRHEPLHLHFTAYLGTEPFPNHYDAYVPVRFISELETYAERTLSSVTAVAGRRLDSTNTEVLSARAFEIISSLETNFEISQESREALLVELENILRSPFISEAFKQFLRQKLQKLMLRQSLQHSSRNWNDDSEPPPAAGGSSILLARSLRNRRELPFAATTSSATQQTSLQVSAGEQQRMDASIPLSIPLRASPLLSAASS